MLRDTFDDFNGTSPQQAHKDDHRAIHRRLNGVILADDYDSLQSALNAAASRNLRSVYLNAGRTYDIAATLNVPPGVTIDGDGATIRATTALDAMIATAQYATVTRCRLHAGNGLAAHGIYLSKISERLIDNLYVGFANADGAVLQAGGALYTWLERNYVQGAAGYALDAINAYSPTPQASYYGMNVFTSIGNAWGGRKGVRIEGFGQSRGDTWELTLDGDCAMQIGGSVQSQIAIDGGYFEMTRGLANELTALRIMGSARATIRDCQMHGQMGEPGRAVHCNTAYGLVMTGCVVNRWATGIGGGVSDGAQVMVGGNAFYNTTTAANVNNLANARVALWSVG